MKIKNLIITSITLFALNFLSAQTSIPENITQKTIHDILEGNQNHIVQLAEAFTEDQYDWKPMDGVDSVGEAILHVTSTNYAIGLRLGFAPPEEVKVMKISKIKGKENIINALKKSNEFIKKTILKVESKNLNNEIDLGFAKMSTLSGLLIIMEHNGEHKGQLIAYARSNNITPPWSK
ncbi:DinB family protein [Cellulophaga baltica]|uniref:DinB family protein n=1 Tax=Cellulophaga TaxID=104264 RepID=UPI001C0711B9|nr:MULTISPECIES: DinB family protein [Cellulophaga]MBU2995038.1 DinB family protein [Cellulophaga baltica]MDO6766433.1 DinB family protein [Cellulophaga sp. 1_MG-2023]